MESEKPKIYRLNDDISFRKCTLYNNNSEYDCGDCTNVVYADDITAQYFKCKQFGIHFHCTRHPAIEMNIIDTGNDIALECKECKKMARFSNLFEPIQECKKLLNMERFKNAQLIRLDDWYIPELKQKIELQRPDYWMHVDVKTDKDNDTIIVLYVGKKGTNEKTQFFIKPEKLQLSNDHKDLDPATILTKIEVTLKDRKIKQEYDENN